MFYRIMRFWFTGKDNESYEIMRALTAFTVIVMLIYIGWHLIVNKTFDPLSAAGGMGALLFGGGAGAAIKDGTIGSATKVAVENVEKVQVTGGGEGSRE